MLMFESLARRVIIIDVKKCIIQYFLIKDCFFHSSLVGKPMIWLKQQSPFVFMSSSLCCLSHIQKVCLLAFEIALRIFCCCECETSLCKSLNTIATLIKCN